MDFDKTIIKLFAFLDEMNLKNDEVKIKNQLYLKHLCLEC